MQDVIKKIEVCCRPNSFDRMLIIKFLSNCSLNSSKQVFFFKFISMSNIVIWQDENVGMQVLKKNSIHVLYIFYTAITGSIAADLKMNSTIFPSDSVTKEFWQRVPTHAADQIWVQTAPRVQVRDSCPDFRDKILACPEWIRRDCERLQPGPSCFKRD